MAVVNFRIHFKVTSICLYFHYHLCCFREKFVGTTIDRTIIMVLLQMLCDEHHLAHDDII